MDEKVLFTYGCSFTQGVELKEREKTSWPALLADKMGYRLVNRAYGGASNQRNIRLLIEDLALSEPDYVIFQITDEQRMELCRTDGTPYRFGAHLSIVNADKFLNRYIYYRYLNENFLINRMLDEVLIVQKLLMNKPFKIFFGMPYKEKLERYHNMYLKYHKNLIDADKMIGWPEHSFRTLTQYKFPYGPLDHPLEKAHEFFANYLYDVVRYDHG